MLHLDEKGRGRALRAAWGASHADVVAYMDVDLSTDLDALAALLRPAARRVAATSRSARGWRRARRSRARARREMISRAYNMLLRAALQAGFSDAQCGFKAGRREVDPGRCSPRSGTRSGSSTPSSCYLAQRRKLAIHEVPVRWVEDPDSRVDIIATAREDLRGVMRLRRGRAAEGAAAPLPALSGHHA